jgi:CheY-like chemotaxis protein
MDKKKILVVDDNANFSQLLQCALEDDFDVTAAADGLEGVKLAEELRPYLILLDVKMPNVSGIEMARMLQTEEETKNIPLIVLTGSHMDKGVPDLFKQERNVKLFLSKTTPVLEIVAAAKRTIHG